MKLVINDPTTPEEVPGITAIASEAELVCAPDKERLAEALPGADILLGWNFQSRDMRDQWHRADNLKWIHWCGAAVDRVMSPELRASEYYPDQRVWYFRQRDGRVSARLYDFRIEAVSRNLAVAGRKALANPADGKARRLARG